MFRAVNEKTKRIVHGYFYDSVSALLLCRYFDVRRCATDCGRASAGGE
jgi:hypothetical protein